jgi:CheY-like chemotaxis protein
MQTTILLVEDNDDDAFIFRRTAKQAGIEHPIQVASDGREALRYFKGEGKYADRTVYPLPTIVFLDLKLPYHTGFEILEWMGGQQELRPLTVVMLTSSNEERDRTKAQALGAHAYLVKPPDPDDLSGVLERFKAGRLAPSG